MSDPQDWHKRNEAYLAAGLVWLRRLLEHRAPAAAGASMPVVVPQVQTVAPQVQTVMPPRSGWLGRRPIVTSIVTPASPVATPLVASPVLTVPHTASAEEVQQAADAMETAAQGDPSPALVGLARVLGLSRFEQQLLFLCAALELDTRIAGLCARAQDDPQRPFPTFALALAVLDEPSWDALSPRGPLRYLQLIEVSQPSGMPLTASALRADERIVNAIKGLNELDDRLAPLLAPVAPPADLPPSQQAMADTALKALRQAEAEGMPTLVQLAGPETPSKALVAADVADALGRQLYRLPADRLPTQAGGVETLARLWTREALLLPLALLIDAPDADIAGESGAKGGGLAARFAERCGGVRLMAVREPLTALDTAVVEVKNPTPAEQREQWAAAPELATSELPGLLAGAFNLDGVTIARITRAGLAEGDDAGLRERLWQASIAATRPRIEALADRVDVRATWRQLVLPDDSLALLKRIAEQVGRRGQVYDEWGFRERMSRGLGISALFAGDSGTGKTMAAEVLANELELDLYRIDLSAVISKYIGETEKNLRKLFDAAEDGGAILFFDEADALFGKRSEVKDSHDRYANIEINYLLQRMEAYRGLAILATNMRGALDPAFVRRLRFIVEFDFPGLIERAAIWRRVFPPSTPTDKLDYEQLAQLSLSGGAIQNIALNAAFLAATRKPAVVTMPVVLDAARVEFRKMERPTGEVDLLERNAT